MLHLMNHLNVHIHYKLSYTHSYIFEKNIKTIKPTTTTIKTDERDVGGFNVIARITANIMGMPQHIILELSPSNIITFYFNTIAPNTVNIMPINSTINKPHTFSPPQNSSRPKLWIRKITTGNPQQIQVKP